MAAAMMIACGEAARALLSSERGAGAERLALQL
jgi:hypothetical protein